MSSNKKSTSFLERIHHDLLLTQDLIYKPSGLILQNLQIENESADYGACSFTIKNRSCKFRIGKITPKKAGQFVTFWKRPNEGPISPHETTDPFDFLVVSVRSENHFGQFIFPKKILCEKKVVAAPGEEGKRAMRVYPSWDKMDNSQAKKTQNWQLHYFINFSDTILNISKIKYLLDID